MIAPNASPMAVLTSSAVAVWILQRLKSWPAFKWVGTQKAMANRIAALALSVAGVVGVNAHWDPAAHALTLTGLSMAGMIGAAWLWLKQFVTQEIIYQVAANKPAQAPAVHQPAAQGATPAPAKKGGGNG